MNIINMLKNVAFMVDPGPDENSPLWKMLEAYQTAQSNEEETTDLCTLEDVLESKDVLSFLQHNHQPLTNFLTEKRHLEKLLEYITSCPPSKTILSQRSCKILCHNFASVREAVFADATENLDILFGFESEDQEVSQKLVNLDAMHSGLLTQVVQKFLNTHNWYMVDYFSSKQALRDHPKQLLHSPGLLQTLVDTNYCYSGSALGQWMESINMVDMLVAAFKGTDGESCVVCAGEVLRAIIELVSPLLQQLESTSVVSELLNNAFDPENPCKETAQTQVIIVCTCLAAKHNNEACENIPVSLVPIFDHMDDFKKILAPVENGQQLLNTSGNIVPFGMRRMKVVELYGALLNIGSDEVNQLLLEKGVFQDLLDAFFLYKWNNILQTSVMSMLHTVFHSERHEFCKQVLQQTDLIPRVSKLLMEDLKAEQEGKPVSAYRGFFRTFSSTFLNLRSVSDLSSVFESYPEWKQLLPLLEPNTAQECEQEPESDSVSSQLEVAETQIAEPETQNAGTPSAEATEETPDAFSGVVVEKNTESMDVDAPVTETAEDMDTEKESAIPVSESASEESGNDAESMDIATNKESESATDMEAEVTEAKETENPQEESAAEMETEKETEDAQEEIEVV